jgi:hypothetical protein
MFEFGQPVRIKHIPTLAFSLARQQATTTAKPTKLPGKNWARSVEKRITQLKLRKVHFTDWRRHERNIYLKVTHWFEVIRKVIKDLAVLPENTHNIDKTGVMLSMIRAFVDRRELVKSAILPLYCG